MYAESHYDSDYHIHYFVLIFHMQSLRRSVSVKSYVCLTPVFFLFRKMQTFSMISFAITHTHIQEMTAKHFALIMKPIRILFCFHSAFNRWTKWMYEWICSICGSLKQHTERERERGIERVRKKERKRKNNDYSRVHLIMQICNLNSILTKCEKNLQSLSATEWVGVGGKVESHLEMRWELNWFTFSLSIFFS